MKIRTLSELLLQKLESIAESRQDLIKDIKGRGLMVGIEFKNPTITASIKKNLLDKMILIETCGPEDEVLKFMPPLTIELEELSQSLDIIRDVVVSLPKNK